MAKRKTPGGGITRFLRPHECYLKNATDSHSGELMLMTCCQTGYEGRPTIHVCGMCCDQIKAANNKCPRCGKTECFLDKQDHGAAEALITSGGTEGAAVMEGVPAEEVEPVEEAQDVELDQEGGGAISMEQEPGGRPVAVERATGAKEALRSRLQIKELVTAFYQPATVSLVHPDGSCDVSCDDGDYLERVPRLHVWTQSDKRAGELSYRSWFDAGRKGKIPKKDTKDTREFTNSGTCTIYLLTFLTPTQSS